MILVAYGEDDTENFGKDEIKPLFCGCGEGNRNQPIYGLYSKENQNEENFIISRDNLMHEMSVGRKTNLTIYPCVGYESTYICDNYTNVIWKNIHYSHEKSDNYLLYLKNLMNGKETGNNNNYQNIQNQNTNNKSDLISVYGNNDKPKFIYEEQSEEFFQQNILPRAEGKRKGNNVKQTIDQKNENDNTDNDNNDLDENLNLNLNLNESEGIFNQHKKIKNQLSNNFGSLNDSYDGI